MIGAPILVIPFTVVVKLFTADVLETVVKFVIAVEVNKAPPSLPAVIILAESELMTFDVRAVPVSLVKVIAPVAGS
ncbi:hypothetical protein D3C86_2045950 [compost metagenome]